MVKKIRTLHLHTIPFSETPAEDDELTILWAENDGEIHSQVQPPKEMADWLYEMEPNEVRTLYRSDRRWAFDAILSGQQMRPTLLASPFICTPEEFEDLDGAAMNRMRQCALRPACGGWRRYAGTDKWFHELNVCHPKYPTVLERHLLLRRYMFLSPTMVPEGLAKFVALVGSPRWFATSDCPTGSDELKAYFGLRDSKRRYPGSVESRFQTLTECWGGGTLESSQTDDDDLDILRARIRYEDGIADEGPAIEFMIEYLAANWLHVLHSEKPFAADMDFFVPEYSLLTEEICDFNEFVYEDETG